MDKISQIKKLKKTIAKLTKKVIVLCEQFVVLLSDKIEEEKSKLSYNDIIYKTAKNCLGKDMSAKYNTYGCVEALTAVLSLAGIEMKERLSTYRLKPELDSDPRWKKINEPERGCIIISATHGNTIGHVGIVSDNHKVMSNNSDDSLWDEHFNVWMWKTKYKRLSVEFYKYIG